MALVIVGLIAAIWTRYYITAKRPPVMLDNPARKADTDTH